MSPDSQMIVNVFRREWSIAAALFALLGVGCNGCRNASVQPYFSIAFSPDGKLIAAGRGIYTSHPWESKDNGEVVLWEVETWAEPKHLQSDITSSVKGVSFTGDGREIIAASDAYLRNIPHGANPWDGKRIYSWTVQNGKPNEVIDLRNLGAFGNYPNGIATGSVEGLTYAPKAGLLGMALTGDRPVVIDLKTRKPRYVPEGHQERHSTCLAFSPEEKTLASCVYQFTNDKNPRPVRLFAADTGKLLATSDANGTQPYCLAFSPDGTQLAVGCNAGELLFLTANLEKIEHTLRVATPAPVKKDPVFEANNWVQPTTARVVAVAYSPKGDTLAAATKDAVRLIDVKEKKITRVLGEKLAHVRAVAFSPDGKLLAAAYGTQEQDYEREKPAGGVLVWDVATGKLIKELK